jgi:multidrug resistance efflux pump
MKMKDNLDQHNYSSLEMTKTPPYLRRYANYLFISFFVIFLFLLLAPWQQTSKASGKTVALSPTDRAQAVDAPIEGRIVKWHVQEGSTVKEGDPIAEIFDNDPEILKRLRLEQESAKNRVNAAIFSQKTASLNLERQKILFEKGIVSQLQVERAKIEVAKFDSDVASARAEAQRMSVRLARQDRQIVFAPRSGSILHRQSGEGSQLVKAGDPIAVIVPDTESRAVELYVDGNDIPLIQVGQKARIQFEGWPAIQFSGWPTVAIGTFGGIVTVIDASDNGKGKFRLLIVPDPNDMKWPSARFLRQGARSYGWVLLGEVPLGYELWRQFNGFPPSNLEMTSELAEMNQSKEKK